MWQVPNKVTNRTGTVQGNKVPVASRSRWFRFEPADAYRLGRASERSNRFWRGEKASMRI